MKSTAPRLAVLALVAVLSVGAVLPAAARELPADPAPVVRTFQQTGGAENGGTDTTTVLLWSAVGVGAFALGLGILYLFKRQVGGFPENPDWVAPITVLYSRDLPDEGHFGDAPADNGHGHH